MRRWTYDRSSRVILFNRFLPRIGRRFEQIAQAVHEPLGAGRELRPIRRAVSPQEVETELRMAPGDPLPHRGLVLKRSYGPITLQDKRHRPGRYGPEVAQGIAPTRARPVEEPD